MRVLHISREPYSKWVSNSFINGREEIGIVYRHSATYHYHASLQKKNLQ